MKKLLMFALLFLGSMSMMATDDDEVYVDYNGMRFHRYDIYSGINDFTNLWVYFELVGPVGGGQFSGDVDIPKEIPYHYEVVKNDPMDMDVTHTVTTEKGYVNKSKYSFVNNEEVTSISYPESFPILSCNGCTNLKSVTLPTSPKYIDGGTTTRTMPDGVFENCENLTTIKNLEANSILPQRAFRNCKELSEIDLTNFRVIEDYAFENCINLKTITLNVREIGKAVFAGCTNLQQVEFKNQCTMKGDYLFLDCSSLSSVKGFELLEGPDGTYRYTLRNGTFKGCKKLTDITLSNKMEKIGESAFEGCESLKNINVNAVLKQLKKRAFMDCKSLERLPIDWEMTWNFPDSTFYRCHNLDFSEELHISAANNHTFGECYKLSHVLLQGKNNVIKDSAFIDCHALVNFTYEGYQKIYEDTPEYNRTFRFIEVGEGGFCNCTSLIQLKAWLSHVKKDGFNGCTNLPSAAFYDGCYNCGSEGHIIGEHAFQNCNSLNRITIFHPEIDDYYDEDGRSVWGNEAFIGCNSIKDVYLIVSHSMNDMATTHGNYPLTEIIPMIDESTFPDNIYKSGTLHFVATHFFSDYSKNAFFAIGWNLFANVKTGHLKKNSDELLSYDGKKYYYMDNAALACYEDGDLYIPEKDNDHIVTKIGNKAFKDNHWIESIHLPMTIRRIGARAFDNCSSLKSIYVRRTIPITFNNDLQRHMRPFEGIDYENVILYVPKDCYAKYRTANEWKRFKHIVETNDEGGYWRPPHEADSPIIDFFDELTEEICLYNWDSNSSESLSEREAANVKDLGLNFKGTEITAFCELKFFTGLKTIAQNEFSDCIYLDSITFPKNITEIGDKAFSGCNSLKMVFTKIQSPAAFNDNVFTQTAYDQAWLVVPVGKVDTYKATAGWKNFKNICEEGSEPGGGSDEIKGDLTGDGEVNGTDLVQLVKYVLQGSNDVKAADLNGDGEVNGTDLVILVNIILGKQ